MVQGGSQKGQHDSSKSHMKNTVRIWGGTRRGTSYEVWGGSRSRRVRDWQRLEFVTLSLLFDCPPGILILGKFNLNYVKRVNPPNSQKDKKNTLKRASIFSSSSTKSPIFCFTGLERSITSSGLKLNWMKKHFGNMGGRLFWQIHIFQLLSVSHLDMCENLRDLLYTSELSSGSVWGRDFDEDSDFTESESLDKARTL